MSRLWLPALPAALLFSAAFFLMLPMAAAAAPRGAGALLLGCGSALSMVFRQKRDHLRRHVREALFLGFDCSVKGSLWSPFSSVELLFRKTPGSREEDGLLADLVRLHGPDYELAGRRLAGAGVWAAVCAAGLVVLMSLFRPLMPALVPLFSLAALVFLVSKTETLLAVMEREGSREEASVPADGGAGYRQWNFLSLEAKRADKGRIPAMEADIKRVLLAEAGLAAGSAVLETGAGGGFLWKHIPGELRAGWTQAEKDPLAALYAERHGNGTRFRVSDVKALPFPAASFDAVVGLECFDSLCPEDLAGFLPEALRVLKPGGRLVHLKDFPDWPGEQVAGYFNAFALKALRRGVARLKPSVMDGLRFMEYAALGAGEAAALKAAVQGEGGLQLAYARTLAGIYAAGPDSDPRFRVPMFASAMALREIFAAAGFEIAADCLGPAGAPGIMAYIVARKPA